MWGVMHCGCTCCTLSVREESRGLPAALCLSASFGLLCSLCWSKPTGWSQEAVKCVFGEWADIHCLLFLELTWCHSLFWGIGAVLNLASDGGGHGDGMSHGSQYTPILEKYPRQFVLPKPYLWCQAPHRHLSTEGRVLGRKVPMQVSVQDGITCLCVPVHPCLHSYAGPWPGGQLCCLKDSVQWVWMCLFLLCKERIPAWISGYFGHVSDSVFLMHSPSLQTLSQLSVFGPKLLPLPSMSDFPESPARCRCSLQMLFGLISVFVLFLEPTQNPGTWTLLLH